jgi:hypothetical protein
VRNGYEKDVVGKLSDGHGVSLQLPFQPSISYFDFGLSQKNTGWLGQLEIQEYLPIFMLEIW